MDVQSTSPDDAAGGETTFVLDGRTVSPSNVRYIKLGGNGDLAEECIRKGFIYIGFGTHLSNVYEMAITHDYDSFSSYLKGKDKSSSVAKRHTNEVARFFEDTGETLWITFHNEKLYWCFLELDQPEINQAWQGVTRKVHNRWRCQDISERDLAKNALSGSLTQIAAYRGTSCRVRPGEYTIRRILGQTRPEVDAAVLAMEDLREHTGRMIGHLGPKDFEVLVDLIFSTSGWRRMGATGGTQKFIDVDMVLPSTGERAFIQAKMRTKQSEFDKYLQEVADTPFDRMFYAYNEGNLVAPDGARAVLLNGERVAKLAVDAGLVQWIIDKVQ